MLPSETPCISNALGSQHRHINDLHIHSPPSIHCSGHIAESHQQITSVCRSGHIALADGTLEACAVKRLPYNAVSQEDRVHAELDSLQLAVGMPHMPQCLAAFLQTCPTTGERHVHIATRSGANYVYHFSHDHCCKRERHACRLGGVLL